MKQACADGWAAGLEAKAQLERLVANGSIQCEARGRDRPAEIDPKHKFGLSPLGATSAKTASFDHLVSAVEQQR
jgi:hypothetical protein